MPCDFSQHFCLILPHAHNPLTMTNNDDQNAEAMARNAPDKAILRALHPDKETSLLAKLASLVVSLLLSALPLAQPINPNNQLT
jgi:hypothetical protein